MARDIKQIAPQIPCVVLTPFSHGITKRIEHEDMSIFDYVFCWLGNTNLILSIIKLIEDRMNIEHDIKEAGVQMIMLVEDNIRFYSSVLRWCWPPTTKKPCSGMRSTTTTCWASSRTPVSR